MLTVSSWLSLHPVFSASRLQDTSDMHSKFTLRPHHVWSVVDIESATAEIRRGKTEEEEEEEEERTNYRSENGCY